MVKPFEIVLSRKEGTIFFFKQLGPVLLVIIPYFFSSWSSFVFEARDVLLKY